MSGLQPFSYMPQSLAKNYIHLVFSTKGRMDTIPKAHLKEVHAYVAEILNSNHCPALSVGGTANHIHILYVLSKTMTLSDSVRLVKANSSKWINEKNGKLAMPSSFSPQQCSNADSALRSVRRPFNPFAWQDGYGAFSISQGHVDAVKHYIEGQEEHHKGVDFMDEFRKICNMYGVGLDERYAWD